MQTIEVVSIIILILGILVLIYYYLLNNPSTLNRIRDHVPATSSIYPGYGSANDSYNDSLEEDEEKTSMGKKLKVKLSDIDMSAFNTDIFSKKFDAFLDEKSDQLIQEWSLATQDDLSKLEEKFSDTVKSVDTLEDQFKNFKATSDKKFEDFEKRIEALEEK